jgi:glycogen operon protein
VDDGLLSFTAGLVAFRRAHPVFRRHRFLTGAQTAELSWFTPAGTPMTSGDWSDPNALAVGIYLDGSDDPDRAADGTLLLDDDFLVLVNAWWEPLDFTIGPARPGQAWQLAIDSYDPQRATGDGPAAASRQAGDRVTVGPRSVCVLRGPRAAPQA